MRTFVIGDVHGCLDEFKELLRDLRLKKTDRVICLGDLVDKGPYGAQCVRMARERGFLCLLGNHEEYLLRWAQYEERAERGGPPNPLVKRPDGDQLERLSQEDMTWLYRLPHTIRLHSYVLVHAGLLPSRPIYEQDDRAILRLRYVDSQGSMIPLRSDETPPPGARHWSEVYDGPSHVLYGHDAQSLDAPICRPGDGCRGWTFGLDTGCVYGGRLTAAEIDLDPARIVWHQVPARRAYHKLIRPAA